MTCENPLLLFPLSILESLEDIPEYHVTPCSVLYRSDEAGGLYISLTKADAKYFKISPKHSPEPQLRFRMLHDEKQHYVMIIQLHFTPTRIMNLHLDPNDKNTRNFMKCCHRTGMISFHFSCPGNGALGSMITSLDETQADWMKRNTALLASIRDTGDYMPLSEYIIMTSPTERHFRFLEMPEKMFFIKKNAVHGTFPVKEQH